MQDYAVTFKALFDLWAQKKLSHEEARKTAVTVRCLGAERLVSSINWTEERELAMQCAVQVNDLRQLQEETLGRFRTTPAILEWQRQYQSPQSDKALRFKPLLLQGASQSGKSRKAISIFGHAHTLIVNCQGLGNNLPSLRGFLRSEHKCIVFDEASSQQVLANKLVFQAGVDELTLSQSACNAHAYSVWLFAVPMVLCSNYFQVVSRPGSKMAPEDEEYLARNLVDGSLPVGDLWYEKPPSAACSSSDGE